MNPLTRACSAVTRGLATNQIGTPVAARILAHGVGAPDQLRSWLAYAMDTVVGWLRSAPRQLSAMAPDPDAQIAALVSFAGGQTALLSVGSGEHPIVEITVWGTRGVWSWEADLHEAQGSTRIAFQPDTPPTNAHALTFLDAIHESLATRQSVLLAGSASSSELSPRDRDRATRASGDSAAPGTFAVPSSSAILDIAARPIGKGRSPTPVRPPFGVLLVTGDQTHQPSYAELLKLDPRCRLIGMTDESSVSPRRQQLNAQLAARLGIPLLPDLAAALARDDVHVVSVCAEPMRRGRIIVPAAEAGKHLYLDKPLAGTLSDAQAIVAAVNRAGVVGHMMSLVRSDVAGRMRASIEGGKLGDLRAVHADLCFAKGRTGTADLTQPRRESPVPNEFELPDSKREFNNIGVYPLVALLWLTGRQVRRVVATTGNYFFCEHQRNGMEDFGQALLELDGGLIATVSAGRTGWQSHPLGGLNRTTVIGTRRAMTFDPYRPRAVVFADSEPWSPPERDPDDPMGMWSGPKSREHVARPKQNWIAPAADAPARDVTYFLDCVEAGRQSDVSVNLAADVTEILLACYRSSAAP